MKNELAYKLIAADLDGTLLNNSRQISSVTRNAIRLAQDRGVIFTFSTGRPLRSTLPFCDALGADVPVITYNGARIETGLSRTVIFSKPLDYEAACRVYSLAGQYHTIVIVWCEDMLYSNIQNERVDRYRQMHNTAPIIYKDISEFKGKEITKLLLIDDPERIAVIKADVDKQLCGTVTCCTSSPDFLEVVAPGISKAHALGELCHYYGIDRSEIIAIGDGSNDLSMIEYAGLGIAMANGSELLKASADYITASNEEDGVARAIERFILNN